MKRLFTFIFLLLVFISFNSNAGIILRTRGNGCDDCSGDLMFSWHMENTNIETGTPCGCVDSSGDTDASLTGGASISGTQYSDGSNSVNSPNGQDYYTFDSASDDNFNDAEGKIVVDVYVGSFIANTEIIRIDDNSSTNRLVLKLQGTSTDIYVQAIWTGDGSDDFANTPSGQSYQGEDEWLRITYQWKVAASTADHKTEICDLTPPDSTSNCQNSGAQDDITGWTSNASYFDVGNNSATACDYYIDNLEVYATSGL
jgi:hypothetical protein